jgi:hypothetical protein
MQIAAQIVGFAGVGLYLLSYQLKKRKHIVGVTCASNVLYVLQYILLGAFSGAAMDVLATVASWFAVRKHAPRLRAHMKWIAPATVLMTVVVGSVIAILRRDWMEILPIAGSAFQIIGLWCDDEQTIRKFGLLGAPFWLVYNAASGAYGPTLGSAFAIVSIIVALVRYRKAKLPETEIQS